MAYVTQAQLEDRFASLQWWTDDLAAGAIEATIVATNIAAAEGQINGAAGQHYDLPLGLADANTAAIAAASPAASKWAARRSKLSHT